MKLGILHHNLEWAEEELQRQFQKRGIETDLLDIRTASIEILRNYDLILNRIYASVANRNYQDNLRALNLMEELEKSGVHCINSFFTTKADYNKYFASKIMKENGILNPETILIKDLDSISLAFDFASKFGYSLIVKRNMGGRGKDIVRVNNAEELTKVLNKMLSPEYRKTYDAGVIIQQFLSNVRGYDCRIAIIDGNFAFAYKRTLIADGTSGDPWLGSHSKGSELFDYTPTAEEIDLARKATGAIGALLNEIDMTFTEQGPAIIENNPTPSHDKTELDRVVAVAEWLCLRCFA